MRSILLIPVLVFCFLFSQSQERLGFTVSADKNNVLYVGVANPISVTVENLPSKSIIVKASSGKIEGKNGKYIFTGDEIGPIRIGVYRKVKGEEQILGIWPFRLKQLPQPSFKIGSNKDKMTKDEIANQQFVRAELEGFDFDARFAIDSFTVCIVSGDTCKFTVKKNHGQKISEEIKNDFNRLHPNDVIVFKDIHIKHPDGYEDVIAPKLITIKE